MPQTTPPPKRKRGGQPGNTNAFKHGLYARRSTVNPIALLSPKSPVKIKTLLDFTQQLAGVIFNWVEKTEHDEETDLMFTALYLAIYKPAFCAIAIQDFVDKQPERSLGDAFRHILSLMEESDG